MLGGTNGVYGSGISYCHDVGSLCVCWDGGSASLVVQIGKGEKSIGQVGLNKCTIGVFVCVRVQVCVRLEVVAAGMLITNAIRRGLVNVQIEFTYKGDMVCLEVQTQTSLAYKLYDQV